MSCAAAIGMIFSRVYWGYWTRPPSIRPWVEELRSAEMPVFVECEPGMVARVTAVSDSHSHQMAAAYLNSPRDYPGYQLLAALEATRIPTEPGIPSARDVEALSECLFASHVVRDGSPGYEYARYVRGFLVDGRTSSNERVWLWSAIGGEISNDHHAVYDLEFEGGGALRRSHVYFEDIAGIEGVRWYVVSGFAFIVGTLLLAVLVAAVGFIRLVTTRWTRFAADSGPRHN